MQAHFAIASSAITGDASRLDEILIDGIPQVELGFFQPGDLPALRRFLDENHLTFGIHDPLLKGTSFAWPRFTGPNEEDRLRSLRQLESNFPLAAEWGARYVVSHLPSSMLDPNFQQDRTSTWDMARRSGEAISTLSARYGVPILMENVGPNRHFQTAEDFQRFFADFPALRFCLDIGHLELLHLRTGIDPVQFARDMAPLTSTVHVYTARLPEYHSYRHVAAHPSLSPADGWSDVAAIVRVVLESNPACTLVFEHNVFYPGGREFTLEGVSWLMRLVERWK